MDFQSDDQSWYHGLLVRRNADCWVRRTRSPSYVMRWVGCDGLEVRRTPCVGLRATDWKSVVRDALGWVRRTGSPSYTMRWVACDGLEVRRTECVGREWLRRELLDLRFDCFGTSRSMVSDARSNQREYKVRTTASTL